MESSLPSWVILVVTLLVIAVVKIISWFHYQSSYWKKKGGPYFEHSTFGVGWTVFIQRKHFKDYFEIMYKAQPDLKYTGGMDFQTPYLLIRDPELVRDITIKNFEYFPDHQSFIPDDTDPIFGRNVFSLKGERWKEMRNTLSPSFTTSKMKFMHELVSKCSNEFVDYLAEHPEEYSVVELKQAFTRYTTDVIATVAFGVSVNSMKDQDNEFFQRGSEISKFGGLKDMIKFTLFRICPRVLRHFNVKFLSKNAEDFFMNLVSETIKVRKEKGIVRPDMIHLLMQAAEGENSRLEIVDIVAQAFIFFLAGFETSSLLMCFMVHELAMNPDMQERLRKEVDTAIAERNGEINYEMLGKLEYMDMVINETLRMYPPAIFLDRYSAKEYTFPAASPNYQEVTISPKTLFWIPVYSFHHDAKYFPEPEKFDPERFNEENKANIIPYTYLPFGTGPRKCIGERFALMETKLLMVRLLQKFVIKQTEKTMKTMVFDKKSFNLRPINGFWVALERRKDNDI